MNATNQMTDDQLLMQAKQDSKNATYNNLFSLIFSGCISGLLALSHNPKAAVVSLIFPILFAAGTYYQAQTYNSLKKTKTL